MAELCMLSYPYKENLMASAMFQRSNWHDSYRAALFETDRHQLPNRIAQAEQAIITRGRELFQSPQSFKEREALDAALYGLRAFRRSLEREDAVKQLGAVA
jgi:hypothetical protein